MPTYDFTIYPPPLRKGAVKMLTGQSFGKLLVLGFAGSNQGKAMWHCLCECGNGITAQSSNLIKSDTKSCGCLQTTINIRHGHSVGGGESRTYKSHHMAKNRCNNPQYKRFEDYGGRGIEFRFESFEEFYAELGERPPKTTLHRIDNDGHYEVGNVKWATNGEQARHKRNNIRITAFGETKILADWLTSHPMSPKTLSYRIKQGWCPECSLTLPPHQRCSHRQ